MSVKEYMRYDDDDHSEVPSLEDFKKKLINMSLRSSFYQNEVKEQINMLKVRQTWLSQLGP